jgi:hypothetical protein
MVTVATAVQEEKKAVGGASNGLFEDWLPLSDDLRTYFEGRILGT